MFLVYAAAAVFLIASVSLSFYFVPRAEFQAEVAQVAEPLPVQTVEELYPYIIAPRSTLSSVLTNLGVNHQVIHQIVEAAKPVSNLANLLPGTRFQLKHEPGIVDSHLPSLTSIKFWFSRVESLEIKKVDNVWVAEKFTEPIELRTVTFAGSVSTTIWESAVAAQMDPSLISELAEVFAWQVDFAREVRIHDRWRISVEQKVVKGEPIGWGSILAAEYENQGRLHSAALFRVNGESRGYFAPDGTSLRRMFLKSPIRYGRISSRFNRKRFHPILNVSRAHLGVDYAAPTGTPIRAVGNGVISSAGWSGGGGKVIKIRHNSTYSTAYKHLSKFAPGIRAGSIVTQGQTIGYVGSTGLSTGPHLHFEFYAGGRFVDPLGQKFPSADPVPHDLLMQFQADAGTHFKTLPDWGDVHVTRSEPARDTASSKNL